VTGLLALLGGSEHRPGCEAIDRRLLDDVGSADPKVTVVLAATTPRRRAFKTNEALTYWTGLGCRVEFAMNGGADETERALEALADPDIVVMTGGHPWLLHHRLEGSPVWDRILELWQSGVPLSGSSAGAIAMCEWRHDLRPPRPFRLVRAFGLVPGTAAAPHFSRYGLDRWAAQVGVRNPSLRILGLDDRTALVGRGSSFKVYGEGGVTLLQATKRARFGTGAGVDLAFT
jgi:cyanophycinase